MCNLCQSRDPDITSYDTHIDDAPSFDGRSASALPSFSLEQIGEQLTTGYWEDSGRSARSFDIETGDTLTYDVTGLGAEGAEAALQAFNAWTAATGIRFAASTGPQADIDFTETGDGAYASAYTQGETILSATVNIAASWVDYGGYYLQTYIHEIGHALGLGHAGNYNGSANYPEDSHYQEDSWQYSVMSYNSQGENTDTNASTNYVATPMMGDIMAMTMLYGASTDAKNGNTTYGLGSEDAPGMDLSRSWAITINDNGGTDLINLSNRSYDQRIDLTPETFSDINGETGNLAIMRGTLIENVMTGSGDDHLTTNAADNHIQAGSGDDTIIASSGADTIEGGAGSDDMLLAGSFADYRADVVDGMMTLVDTDQATTFDGVEELHFSDGSALAFYDNNGGTGLLFYETDAPHPLYATLFDVEGVETWTAYRTTFDSDGNTTETTTWYDDGRIEVTGSEEVITETDDAGVEDWSTRSTTYRDGEIVSRTTVMDDGVSEDETYADGLLSRVWQQDLEDNHAWSSIETRYEAGGAMSTVLETLDNGDTTLSEYQDDFVFRTTQTDVSNTNDWAVITSEFDEEGDLLEQTTTDDAGYRITEAFESGNMTTRTLEDAANHDSYDRLVWEYDSQGDVVRMTQENDEGPTEVTSYNGGRVESIAQLDVDDDAFWASDTMVFHSDGSDTRIRTFDSGLEIATLSDAPALETFPLVGADYTRSRVRTDHGDNFAWETYTTTFDGAGTQTGYEILFDDGMRAVGVFEDGRQVGLDIIEPVDLAVADVQNAFFDIA